MAVSVVDIRPVADKPVPAPPTPIDMDAVAAIVNAAVAQSSQDILAAISQVVRQSSAESSQDILAAIAQVVRQSSAESAQGILRAAHVSALNVFHANASAAFRGVGHIFSARFALIMAVIGAVVITATILREPTAIGAAILGGFVASTVWPLVWLAAHASGTSGTTTKNA